MRMHGLDTQHVTPEKKMCILCVKRPEYMKAAIANINSLHFFNPSFKCEIYCDDICFDFFESHKEELDYPQGTTCINLYKKVLKPWQQYKYETIVKISAENGVLVDADSRWFSEPRIERNKVMFLCPAYKVSVHPNETALLKALYQDKKVEQQTHYATGFLSIPAKFATKKLWSEVWKVYEYIRTSTNDTELLRLKDEIALNVAIQIHVPLEAITVLKDSDGPWDKRIILSYYYGCFNRIIE